MRVTWEMNRSGKQDREFSCINYIFDKEQRVPLDRNEMIKQESLPLAIKGSNRAGRHEKIQQRSQIHRYV